MELRKGMPDPGERIKTPDGMAVVTSSNILENKIKTRLILAENDKDKEQSEKLSTEFYHYRKEEIKRLGRNNKKKKNEQDEIEEGLLEEIKDLLKD
jgi:hypothetical protein